MYKIIDVHTHIYPDPIALKAKKALEKFYNFTCEGDGTVSDLAASSKNASVSGMLLLAVATNAHQVKHVNDSIAKARDELVNMGFEVAAFAGFHQDTEDFEAELDHIKSLSLAGIKLHPDIQGVDIDDPRMYKLYDMVQGVFPIYFHMGDDRAQYRFSEANKLIKIMKEFPKLKVGAAHLGGYMAWDEAEDLRKAGKDNIMFDTSSSLWAMSKEKADEIISKIGTEKLMFGTDYPVMRAENELKLFMRLNLNEKERQDVLYNNAKHFVEFKKK